MIVFGAGYSDPNGTVLAVRRTKDAMRSGAADAQDTDTIIRDCFGLPRAQVFIRFITPHWHIDHVNQGYLGGLVALGYTRLSIETHVLDHERAFSGYRALPIHGDVGAL